MFQHNNIPSSDQITAGYVNMDLNNPPSIPNIDVPDYLYNIYPTICAALAMEIQNKAQSNPLRVFMFNDCANNQFNNDTFASLVVGTVDLIAMELSKGSYNDPERAAQNLIPNMVEMVCAVNVKNYPALERHIQDQNTYDAISSLINKFESLRSEIANFKNRGGSRFQNVNNYNSGRWGNNNNSNNSRFAGGFGNNQNVVKTWGNNTRQSSSFSSFTVNGGGGNLNSSGSVREFSQYANNRGSSNTNTDVSNKGNDMTTPQQSTNQQPQADVQIRQLASSGKIKWVPSNEFPYLIAYRPGDYEMYFTLENGKVVPGLEKRREIISIMDYEKHAIGTAFGIIPSGLDLGNAQLSINTIRAGVDKMAQELDPPPDAEKPSPYSTVIKPEKILDFSLDNAWLSASVDRSVCMENGVPGVYHCFAIVPRMFITKHDDTVFLKNLAASKSFIELREKLVTAVNDVDPAVLQACKKRMVETINRLIKQNIGIAKLSITDYVADIQELIDILERKFGTFTKSAFLKNQAKIIASAFGVDFDTTYGKVFDTMVNDTVSDTYGNKELPHVALLPDSYTLTFVNCLSHELDIALDDTVGVSVPKEDFPVFHGLIEALFESVDKEEKEAPEGGHMVYNRHLIRTNDDRIIEVVRGAFNEEVYLATVID